MDGLWASMEEYLGPEQVELDDLVLSGRTLRVTVDAEEGLDLDRISELSRGLSRLLDGNDDFLGDRYNLEVTSPGLERKLRRPRHYQKSVGREVVVKTTTGEKVRGELTAADSECFQVEADGDIQTVPYDRVASARTVFTVPSRPKPGKQQPAKRKPQEHERGRAGKPAAKNQAGEQDSAEKSLTGKSK